MKIFISAAEISSDLQAEKILTQLIALYPPGTVEIAGIGGPKLRSLPGFQCIQNAESLRAMGFSEVLSKLSVIRNALSSAVQFMKAFQPDLILTFDYPDFHLRMMKQVSLDPQLAKAVKICGIPPKVWVWRTRRIEKISSVYDAVWVIFPFEEALYQSHGVPVIYAGNPLIADVLKSETPENLRHRLASGSASLSSKSGSAEGPMDGANASLAQRNSGYTDQNPIFLAVLPGSRDAELKYHLPLIPEVLERLAELSGRPIRAEVPVPAGLALSTFESVLKNTPQVHYEFSEGNSADVLARNSFGLIKSGTSTLEAAVLGCVPVIFYKVSRSTEWIFQFLIRYSGPVGLPNILLGIKNRKEAVFPEFLGPEASPDALAKALLSLVRDVNKLDQLQEQGRSLRAALIPDPHVAQAVAKKIKAFAEQPMPHALIRPAKAWIGVASFLWSSLNGLRRTLYRSGILKTARIAIPSVLVGNLQAGGAGKTPIVIEIAKEAVRRGLRVGVVSRAYGVRLSAPFILVDRHDARARAASEIGDEPAEILAEVPEVTLGLGADRFRVARALEAQGINFIIFDDGFQNLKFKAQKIVLAVTSGKRNELVYRDFDSAAQQADLVLHTKGPRTCRWGSNARSLEWKTQSLPSGPLWLFCAVADPTEVAHYYLKQGVNFKKVITMKDHSAMSEPELQKWVEAALADGCKLAITPKDATKVNTANFPSLVVLKRKIQNRDWLDLLFER